jgi:hypothetical protein
MDTIALYTNGPRRDMARDNACFLDELRRIVGRRYVLTSPQSTPLRYRLPALEQRFELGRLAEPSSHAAEC